MKVTLICLCALAANRFLGEPKRWHPLTGFGWLARHVERIGYGPGELDNTLRWLLGTIALLILVMPPVLVAWQLAEIAYLGPLMEGALLYLALDIGRLRRQAEAVMVPLRNGQLDHARSMLGQWVSRDSGELDEEDISQAVLETVLKEGSRAMLGALFWFLLAGGSGALAYRLIAVLNDRWGYPTPRYRYYGWSAAFLYNILNWIPARLTALSYGLVGDGEMAWRCWRKQRRVWYRANTDAVIAAGAGALNLQLGGAIRYYGRTVERPVMGEGVLPRHGDIRRALGLLDLSLVLWLGILLISEWFLYSLGGK